MDDVARGRWKTAARQIVRRIAAGLLKSVIVGCAVACGMMPFPAVSAAYPYECYAPSPSFADGKTPFDAIIVRELSPSEKKAVLALLTSLRGKWDGDGEDFSCRGSEAAFSIEQRNFSLDAAARLDHRGALTMDIRLYFPAERVKASERMLLYVDDNKLRYNETGGNGDVELLDVGATRLNFLQRGRGGPMTINRETIVTLDAGKNAFILKETVYTQGKFTFGRVLHFSR